MSKVFRRKQFSNYLGEQRAIDDIISEFVPDPSSTPFPSPTPTNTPTPSTTPNPLCPQELIISDATQLSFYPNATYTRSTTYTGGTFVSAYYDGSFDRIKIGTAPDGKDYALFIFNSGSTYYHYTKLTTNERWGIIRTTGATWLDGGDYTGALFVSPTTNLYDGSVYYPTTGLHAEGTFVEYYLSYPISCPTPTPTPTPSITPSLTPSITPTNSPTPSITPTLTSSPTPTPSITPTLTPSLTPTLTPTPSPAPMYSFSGAVYDASSNSGACVSSTVVSNLWGFNPVWTGNTGLFTDNIGTIPAPAGFYNYNDVVLEVIAGGGIPNPPYECPPVTPTPTPTNTPTPSPPAFDTDAALYLNDVLNQGGSLDATISAATNTLFTDLKSNGLYSKLDILYLMLGETSGSTALNAIRTNSSFDITWNNVGSLTFNYSGVTGGGTGYGNTNYNPNIESSPTDNSHGYYIVGGNIGGNNGEVYAFGSLGGGKINTAKQNSGSFNYWIYGYDTGSAQAVRTFTNWSGSYIQVLNNTPLKSTTKDASGLDTQTVSGTPTGVAGLPTQPYYLFTLNLNGSPYTGNYYTGRIQSAFAGDALTPSEVTTIDSLINTFHTTLGRNIY